MAVKEVVCDFLETQMKKGGAGKILVEKNHGEAGFDWKDL